MKGKNKTLPILLFDTLWLTSQGKQRTIKWYEKWSQKLDRKTQIFIGGIFPISGTKYVAPELAPGRIRSTRATATNWNVYDYRIVTLQLASGRNISAEL